jgi:quinol-cytochrome oxidoreductase complex cytochrome b subunit
MMEGFFGYLLPWDQTAYWATVVGVNLQATGPFVGPFLGPVLQGGHDIGPDTLARFYSLHMLVIPGALAGLIGLHLWLVVRIGVSSPPWSPTEAGRPQPGPPPAPRKGLVAPAPRGARRR